MSTDTKKNKPQASTRKAPLSLSASCDATPSVSFPAQPPFWSDPAALLMTHDAYTRTFERELLPLLSSAKWLQAGPELLQPPHTVPVEPAKVSPDAKEVTAADGHRLDARSPCVPTASSAATSAPSGDQTPGASVGAATSLMKGTPPAANNGTTDIEKKPSREPNGDTNDLVAILNRQIDGELLCTALVHDIVERSSEVYLSRCFDRIKHGFTACALWDEMRESVARAFLACDNMCVQEIPPTNHGASSVCADQFSTTQYLSELGTAAHDSDAIQHGRDGLDFLRTGSRRLQAEKEQSSTLMVAGAGAPAANTMLTSPATQLSCNREACPGDAGTDASPGDAPPTIPIDDFCRYVVRVCSATTRDDATGESSTGGSHSSPAGLQLTKASTFPNATEKQKGSRSALQRSTDAARRGADTRHGTGARPATSPITPADARGPLVNGRKMTGRPRQLRGTARRPTMSAAPNAAAGPHAGQNYTRSDGAVEKRISGGEVLPEDALTTALTVLRYRGDDREISSPESAPFSAAPHAVASRLQAKLPTTLLSIDGCTPVALGNVARERQRNLARSARRLEGICAGAPAIPTTLGDKEKVKQTDVTSEPAEERVPGQVGRVTISAGPDARREPAGDRLMPVRSGKQSPRQTGKGNKGKKTSSSPTPQETAFVSIASPQGQSKAPDGGPETVTASEAGSAAPLSGRQQLDAAANHSTPAVEVAPQPGVAILDPKSAFRGGASLRNRGRVVDRRRGDQAVVADGGPFPVPKGKEPWDTVADSGADAAASLQRYPQGRAPRGQQHDMKQARNFNAHSGNRRDNGLPKITTAQ